jgi:hypothetical protein
MNDVPAEDRARFVAANAPALLAERDAKIERMRRELRRLNKTNAARKRAPAALRAALDKTRP